MAYCHRDFNHSGLEQIKCELCGQLKLPRTGTACISTHASLAAAANLLLCLELGDVLGCDALDLHQNALCLHLFSLVSKGLN